jgi:flagellar basal body-associated protein FliL
MYGWKNAEETSMWTELIRSTSNLCSIVCWIALALGFVFLTATGVGLVAMFREEVEQTKHVKRQRTFRPLAKVREADDANRDSKLAA